ncbi:cation:proton antiporter [Edaphobacter aggregans]|uniref:cation:proton antiporter n=1 Tax=Edaphobacter aggregans TaxID=570835 RepID=UPI00068E73B2|nr:cation:proton antiporter [Edaphobacter aggregans]
MTLLLLQMTVVLLITLLCGWIARRLGQARVIGEIAGGILLGPSVFGRIAPHASALLFPPSSLGPFDVLSTVGLILFLFLIGSQLDVEHLRRNKSTATLASGLSILLPFLMAAALAPSLRSRFVPDGVGALPFALFLGVSISITAFPVLARILEERQMQSTSLGTTALMCAAVDDVSAWTLLAVALALIPHSASSMVLPYRLLWLGIYLIFMVGVVRPLGKRLVRHNSRFSLSYELLGIIVAVTLASAAATEAIGVHPLFGAFLAGVCFPRVQHWQGKLRAHLEMIVSVLLLPLFFALTGMRTRLDLLSGTRIWFWTAVVLAVAVAGKMGGAVLAARWTGESWKNALALGALLNTRGLVELIVLNIAYNAGVFSPTLFSMLVVMALITTMMTTPILNLLGVRHAGSQNQDRAIREAA